MSCKVCVAQNAHDGVEQALKAVENDGKTVRSYSEGEEGYALSGTNPIS